MLAKPAKSFLSELSERGATAQTGREENAAKRYATCRQMQITAPAAPALLQRKYEPRKDYYSAPKDARERDAGLARQTLHNPPGNRSRWHSRDARCGSSPAA